MAKTNHSVFYRINVCFLIVIKFSKKKLLQQTLWHIFVYLGLLFLRCGLEPGLAAPQHRCSATTPLRSPNFQSRHTYIYPSVGYYLHSVLTYHRESGDRMCLGVSGDCMYPGVSGGSMYPGVSGDSMYPRVSGDCMHPVVPLNACVRWLHVFESIRWLCVSESILRLLVSENIQWLHVSESIRWLCVTVVPFIQWLSVSGYCVYPMTACIHWLHASGDCVYPVTSCILWLRVSGYCLYLEYAGLTAGMVERPSGVKPRILNGSDRSSRACTRMLCMVQDAQHKDGYWIHNTHTPCRIHDTQHKEGYWVNNT